MEGLRNVFDNKEEFAKLRDLVLDAIKKFAEYRGGNLTYGEIMYVLECVLDNMRGTSEKQTSKNIKGLGRDITFTALFEIMSRMVERQVKKGIITTQDEAFIIHGEE